MESQAHPEQEQDHADLGELLGDLAVGDEAGGERAHQDAGHQVADEGRQRQPVRQVPEEQGTGQSSGERQQRCEIVHGGRPSIALVFPAPIVLDRELKRRYGLERVGLGGGVTARCYAISVRRKLHHPAAAAIIEAGRRQLQG